MRKILAIVLAISMILSLVSMPVALAADGVITSDKTAYENVSRGTEVVLSFSNPVTSTAVEIRNAITIKNGSTDANSALIGMELSADATELTLNFANCALASNTTYTLAATGIKYEGGTFADFSTTVTTGVMPAVLINDNSDAVVTGGTAYYPESQGRVGFPQGTITGAWRHEWLGFTTAAAIDAATEAGTLATDGVALNMSTSNYGFPIVNEVNTHTNPDAIAAAYAAGNDTMVIGRKLDSSNDAGVYKGDAASVYNATKYDVDGVVAVKGSPMKGHERSNIVDSSDPFNGIVHYNWGQKGAVTKTVPTPYEYLWWRTETFNAANKNFKLTTNTGALVNEINLMVPSSSVELFYNDGSDYIHLAGITAPGWQGNSALQTRVRYTGGQLRHYVGGTTDNDYVVITPDVWHNIKYIILPGETGTRNVAYYFDNNYIGTYSVTFASDNYNGIVAGLMPSAARDTNGGVYQLDTNEANWTKQLKVDYDGVSAYYVTAMDAGFTKDSYESFASGETIEFTSSTPIDKTNIAVTVNDPSVTVNTNWKDNDHTMEITLSGLDGNSNYDLTVTGIADICGYTMDDQTIEIATADFENLKVIASATSIDNYIVGTSESVVLKSNLAMDISAATFNITADSDSSVAGAANAVLSSDSKTVTVTLPNTLALNASETYKLTISGIKSGELAAEDIVIPITIKDVSASGTFIIDENFSNYDPTNTSLYHKYAVSVRGYHNQSVTVGTGNVFDTATCTRCSDNVVGILSDREIGAAEFGGEKVFKYSSGTVNADGIHGYAWIMGDTAKGVWGNTPDKTKTFVIDADVYLDDSVIPAVKNSNTYSRLLSYSDVNTLHESFMQELHLGANADETAVTLEVNGSEKAELPMNQWFDLKYTIDFTSTSRAVYNVFVNGTKVYTSGSKKFSTDPGTFNGVGIQINPPAGLTESAVLYVDNLKVYQSDRPTANLEYSDGTIKGKFDVPVYSAISASDITVKDSSGNTVENVVKAASITDGYILTVDVDDTLLSVGSEYTLSFASTVKDSNGYAIGDSKVTIERVFAISLKGYSVDASSNVTVTAGSVSFNNTNITAIVAGYNADKELVVFNAVPGSVPSLGSADIVVPLGTQMAAVADPSALTYKIMLWGTINDMISYVEPLEQTYTEIMENFAG